MKIVQEKDKGAYYVSAILMVNGEQTFKTHRSKESAREYLKSKNLKEEEHVGLFILMPETANELSLFFGITDKVRKSILKDAEKGVDYEIVEV